MDTSQVHFPKQKKPDTKGYISVDIGILEKERYIYKRSSRSSPGLGEMKKVDDKWAFVKVFGQ